MLTDPPLTRFQPQAGGAQVSPPLIILTLGENSVVTSHILLSAEIGTYPVSKLRAAPVHQSRSPSIDIINYLKIPTIRRSLPI